MRRGIVYDYVTPPLYLYVIEVAKYLQRRRGDEGMRKTPEDRAVIQRLYQENAQKLYFVAWRIVQNEAKAEAAVYTCFRKLTEDLALCRNQDYENLERLSVILVKNAAVKMVDGHDGEGRKVKSHNQDVSDACMDRAVRKLDEDERHLLYLKHVMQLGLKKIGILLDMEPEEIEKKLFACREKIRAALEEMSA